MPEISIILPFRDAETTIDECLDSIRRQSLNDFEVIAVDDGSTDTSSDRVGRRARTDRRFRLVASGRRGLVAALTTGITESQAPFLARMDADDRMHPDRLRMQCEFLRDRSELALVASRVRLFPSRHIRRGYREYVRWQNGLIEPKDVAGNIYVESPFAHPSVMIRRSALDAVGGYRDGPFPEDYDLWLRLNANGHPMAKLPEVLLDWRDHPNRLSRTDARYSRESFDRLRALYLARDSRLRSERTFVIWGAGRRTRLRARHLIDRGRHPNAWIDIDPNKIGRAVWGIPVRGSRWLRQVTTRPFVLIYVTRHGAREQVEAFLEASGYREREDFLAVG